MTIENGLEMKLLCEIISYDGWDVFFLNFTKSNIHIINKQPNKRSRILINNLNIILTVKNIQCLGFFTDFSVAGGITRSCIVILFWD
jgi:hypothetical protein